MNGSLLKKKKWDQGQTRLLCGGVWTSETATPAQDEKDAMARDLAKSPHFEPRILYRGGKRDGYESQPIRGGPSKVNPDQGRPGGSTGGKKKKAATKRIKKTQPIWAGNGKRIRIGKGFGKGIFMPTAYRIPPCGEEADQLKGTDEELP